MTENASERLRRAHGTDAASHRHSLKQTPRGLRAAALLQEEVLKRMYDNDPYCEHDQLRFVSPLRILTRRFSDT